MLTEQIRKNIHVVGYGLFEKGIQVHYDWFESRNAEKEERELILLIPEAIKELEAIGEVASWHPSPLMLMINNDYITWDEFTETYVLSQWDAINLVIRHELQKAADQEIENSDIGKAINKILK